ncbi:MAG: hypothetical protein LBJ57_01140 [Prevotellaceae bacterium]|jgi:galactose-1-phosphate uridylyltransferase|nr:hypothetical protein [Prevotellaceae bacterium]
MKHRLFLAAGLLCLLLPAARGYAQSNPQWLIFLPPQAETYYYRVAQATALTEEAALKKAFAAAIFESAFAIGIAVDLSKLEKMSEDSASIALSKFVNIPVNVVCRHVEALTTSRGYRAHVLCQVASNVRVKPAYKTFNCFLSREE